MFISDSTDDIITEDSTSATEETPAVEPAETKERFCLKGELFEQEGAKEFKELIESFVNDHGLPREKVDSLIGLVEKGASYGEEEFGKASEMLQKEAVDNYTEQAQKIANEEFLEWASELSGEEELTNIKAFALKKLGDSCSEEQKAQLLNSTPFLKYMRKERTSLQDRAPSVFSAQKKVDAREKAQKDFYNFLMGNA